MNLERLTERARQVMRRAKEEAARLGSSHASTEHILLGLIAETDSVAVTALRNLGVDLTILRKRPWPSRTRTTSRKTPPALPSGKRAIQFSWEAQSLGVNFMGPNTCFWESSARAKGSLLEFFSLRVWIWSKPGPKSLG
jgi:ATP-dependent Clp protease ATP-binding subunit ClpC